MIEPSDICKFRHRYREDVYIMEETLGKRISANRKRLGLTQDALAEKLGVTAQAVSKWENDQSCPDITMLPKLSDIFGITTDALLGIEAKQPDPKSIPLPQEPDNTPPAAHWEFRWDGGRKSSLALAAWVLLIGMILLACRFHFPFPFTISLWELLWTTGLLVFGLSGIWPRFSLFRFGCAFFGGYFLLDTLIPLPLPMGMDLILPIVLLLFGLRLLTDALRKPQKSMFSIAHDGHIYQRSDCTYQEETFSCETCFGDNHYPIQLSRLSGGSAEVAFGKMTLDLCGCEEIAETCLVNLECAFGELVVLVPREYRTEIHASTAFGKVLEQGALVSTGADAIQLSCDVSFGQIIIRHI